MNNICPNCGGIIGQDCHCEPIKAPRAIYLEGGLVSGVSGFEPNEVFHVIDYDVEDTDPEDICTCSLGRQDDGTNAPHFCGGGQTDEKGEW